MSDPNFSFRFNPNTTTVEEFSAALKDLGIPEVAQFVDRYPGRLVSAVPKPVMWTVWNAVACVPTLDLSKPEKFLSNYGSFKPNHRTKTQGQIYLGEEYMRCLKNDQEEVIGQLFRLYMKLAADKFFEAEEEDVRPERS